MTAAAEGIVLAAFIAFCRIGGCFLLMPGLASVRVPMQIRLFVAVAATGALLAAARPAMTARFGSMAGVAVWAASYFGWIPAMGVLSPAHRHPPARNALMIAAHLVWGAVTAASYRELGAARRTALRDGPVADAPDKSRSTGDDQ